MYSMTDKYVLIMYSMTDGAQQALRRIMEIYSKTTRFALACNASDKIIEPIQSRCAVLRYSKLTDGQILARLQEVVAMENLSVSTDGLEAVIFTAQGDMRQVGLGLDGVCHFRDFMSDGWGL